MSWQAAERDAVETITFTSPFRRRDARELSGRVRDRAGSGGRGFVLDLTGADTVTEGPLILMLLGLRTELQRRSCRLVVAAEDALAQRLRMSLRLDDVIGAASSLEDAFDQVLAPPRAATGSSPTPDDLPPGRVASSPPNRTGALPQARSGRDRNAAMAHAVGTHTEDGGLDRRFAAEPDSVAQARRLVTGWLREPLVGQDRLIGDIALAVTEACNNVVVHAYRTSEGNGDGKTFGLVAERHGTTVSVTVSDDGDGMTPRSDSPGLGLGIPLIATLCDDVKIAPAASGTGTVVAMRFFSRSS